MDHIGARRGGHGAMGGWGGHGSRGGGGTVLLVWISIRFVKILDTGVSFFDKKTSLK